MGGRPLLILLSGLLIVTGRIFLNITESSTDAAGGADASFLRQTAENAAQGGVKLALRQLANDKTWRTGFANLNIGNGRVTVSVLDSVFVTDSAVVARGVGVAGYGTEEQATAVSQVFVRKPAVPTHLRGVFTARAPIKVNGVFTIDGRDHTPAGGLVPNKGIFGVWTISTLNQTGASTIGGTASGVDYAPASPGNPAVTRELQAGYLPGTPDSALGGAAYGYPEGRLKAIAQSGANGSQYVTNPSLLVSPFRAVTYVELPSGGEMSDKDINGSGILVVHNTALNAVLKRVKSGSFRGLIIADDVDGFKNDMIGAIICLTTTPSGSQVMGNATGSLLYSRQAIVAIMDTVMNLGVNGSEANIVAWKE